MKRQLTLRYIISSRLGVSTLGQPLVAVLALCLALLYSGTSFAATTNKDAVAVIIGNKDYVGSVPDVDFAHNDAEAMKRFVIDVLGFREGNIIDLRDATEAQCPLKRVNYSGKVAAVRHADTAMCLAESG